MKQVQAKIYNRATPFHYVFLGLLVLVVVFPIFWLVRTALVPGHLLTQLPPVMRFQPSLEPLRTIFVEDDFLLHLFNSVFVAICATSIGVIVGFSAAYGFSRFDYKGKAVLSVAILCLYVMPPISMILPMFVIFQKLGLAGTRGALILTHSIITVPLSTWTLRGFVARMPVSLEDSTPSRFDGPPRVICLGYQLNEGKLMGPRDMFADKSFDLARHQANEMADMMRRHGPFEPHRLPLEEMEYTTMPQVMEKIQDRFEDLD